MVWIKSRPVTCKVMFALCIFIFIVNLLLVFAKELFVSPNDNGSVCRGGISLDCLTTFIIEHHTLFATEMNIGSSQFAEKFIEETTPLMLMFPEGEVHVNPSNYTTHCTAQKFRSFLSGNILQNPRVIVDFIPFGYDLDKLEIRLAENYYSVMAFVIFETELTQTGK